MALHLKFSFIVFTDSCTDLISALAAEVPGLLRVDELLCVYSITRRMILTGF